MTYTHIFQQLVFFSEFSEMVWFQLFRNLVDLIRNDPTMVILVRALVYSSYLDYLIVVIACVQEIYILSHIKTVCIIIIIYYYIIYTIDMKEGYLLGPSTPVLDNRL